MNKLKVKIFVFAVFVVTLVANISSAMACGGWHYQPKMPSSLQK